MWNLDSEGNHKKLKHRESICRAKGVKNKCYKMAILYELRKVYHHTFHTNNKKRMTRRREPELKNTQTKTSR